MKYITVRISPKRWAVAQQDAENQRHYEIRTRGFKTAEDANKVRWELENILPDQYTRETLDSLVFY